LGREWGPVVESMVAVAWEEAYLVVARAHSRRTLDSLVMDYSAVEVVNCRRLVAGRSWFLPLSIA